MCINNAELPAYTSLANLTCDIYQFLICIIVDMSTYIYSLQQHCSKKFLSTTVLPFLYLTMHYHCVYKHVHLYAKETCFFLLMLDCNWLSSEPTVNQSINSLFYYQSFTGNTDRSTVVENRLPSPVVALCIRLFPMSWLELPCLRMEVIGCNFNASGVVTFYDEGD